MLELEMHIDICWLLGMVDPELAGDVDVVARCGDQHGYMHQCNTEFDLP